MRIEGTSLEGKDIRKTVLLPLNTAGSATQRIKKAGLTILSTGSEVQVMSVDLRSAADKAGFEQGFKVTGVEVVADRMAKEWLYLPALALLGLVFLVQRLRRERPASPASAVVT